MLIYHLFSWVLLVPIFSLEVRLPLLWDKKIKVNNQNKSLKQNWLYWTGCSSFGKWETEGPSSKLNRNEDPGIFFSENFLNPSLVLAKTTEPPTVARIAAPPMVRILFPDLQMKLLQHLIKKTIDGKIHRLHLVWFSAVYVPANNLSSVLQWYFWLGTNSNWCLPHSWKMI